MYPGLPETVSSGTCGPSTIIHSALHSQKCPSLHDEFYGCPKYKWGCQECFSHLCLSALRWDTNFFLNLSVCYVCVFMCMCQGHVCHHIHGLEVRGLPLRCQSHRPPWCETGSPFLLGRCVHQASVLQGSPISASFSDSEAWGCQAHAPHLPL